MVWIEWNETNSLGVMVQVDEIEVKEKKALVATTLMFFGRSACAVWAVNRGIIVLRD